MVMVLIFFIKKKKKHKKRRKEENKIYVPVWIFEMFIGNWSIIMFNEFQRNNSALLVFADSIVIKIEMKNLNIKEKLKIATTVKWDDFYSSSV